MSSGGGIIRAFTLKAAALNLEADERG